MILYINCGLYWDVFNPKSEPSLVIVTCCPSRPSRLSVFEDQIIKFRSHQRASDALWESAQAQFPIYVVILVVNPILSFINQGS